MRTIHTAVFDTDAQASAAVHALRDAGIQDSAISLMGPHGGATSDMAVAGDVSGDADRAIDADGDQVLTDQGEAHAARGALGGGALGALIGAAAFVLPVAAPIAAVGALATIGSTFVMGAGLGAIREIFVKHGMSDEDAQFYDERVTAGGTLVTVETDGDGAAIDGILADAGGRVRVDQAAAA